MKRAHISVDDTWICLYNLIKQNYASVFDEPFFKELKDTHTKTGMCITLNTFNTFSAECSYSISDIPDGYQAEFKSSKDWLRFAFHAENDLSHYWRDGGIAESYKTFTNAIIRLTGDWECIGRVTRLGFFEGTLENILAIKNSDYGIVGLLTADSRGRKSYYLTDAETDVLQEEGRYFDDKNSLSFIRTVTRNNSIMPEEIEANPKWQSNIEVFHHEYEPNVTASISNIAHWLKDNGYTFAFPGEIK